MGMEADTSQRRYRVDYGRRPVVNGGVLAGDLVQFLGDEAGDDIRTDGSIVAAIVEEPDGKREEGVVGDTI